MTKGIFSLVFLLIVFGIFLYHKFDHWSYDHSRELQEDARIVSCATQKIGFPLDILMTTVTFSDSFRYTSYKTKKEGIPGGVRHVVDSSVQHEIKAAAATRHQTLVRQAQLKKKP